jgi:Zn-dependent peptidase ImmA (M78 family)
MPSSVFSRCWTRAGRITPADLCVLGHLFLVSVQMMTLRLEELDLIPVGTWDRLEQEGFKVREAQSGLGLPAQRETAHMLPTRYRYLVAEAYSSGDLTEGQLVRLFRTDRVAARRMIANLGSHAHVSEEGELARETVDLASQI